MLHALIRVHLERLRNQWLSLPCWPWNGLFMGKPRLTGHAKLSLLLVIVHKIGCLSPRSDNAFRLGDSSKSMFKIFQVIMYIKNIAVGECRGLNRPDVDNAPNKVNNNAAIGTPACSSAHISSAYP